MIRLLFISCSWACSCAVAACLPITTDRIRAEDLARANPVFSVVEGTREIGPAPLAGVRRILPAEDVVRLARRFGITLAEPPSEICFERMSESLSADRLRPVLTEALGMERARIEIADFSRYEVAPGSIEFPRSGLAATGFWRGRVVFAAGRSTPIWARISVYDKTTGEPIPLTVSRPARSEPMPKDIERGDAVRVEVRSGGVLLAFEGFAETGGRIGDTVLIKSEESGRRFQATISEKGRVTIVK